MKALLLMCGIVILTACGADFTMDELDATVTEDTAFDATEVVVDGSQPDLEFDVFERGSDAPPKSDLFIEFATCEGDPDEAAVQSGSINDPCSDISVIAWHVEESKLVKVQAEFTWSIEDPSVVLLSGNTGNSQRLSTTRDLTVEGNEPSTVLTVCASYEGSSACNDLVVNVVVSMLGTWCFDTIPLSNPCITIDQKGRWLVIDDEVKGTVYGMDIDFYYDIFELRGVTAPPLHMIGDYWEVGTVDILGGWTATKQQ